MIAQPHAPSSPMPVESLYPTAFAQTPLEIELPRILPITVEALPKRKQATACIRQGMISVVIPQHWPRTLQHSVTEQLSQRIQRQWQRDCALFTRWAHLPTLTFADRHTLAAWVIQINAETVAVPLAGVRLGHAKYTHMAQMNVRSRIMTVSRYAVQAVPESAVRYLAVHELAHLLVPNHSAAFWQWVSRYVPDYKLQRRLISAWHRIRVFQSSA